MTTPIDNEIETPALKIHRLNLEIQARAQLITDCTKTLSTLNEEQAQSKREFELLQLNQAQAGKTVLSGPPVPRIHVTEADIENMVARAKKAMDRGDTKEMLKIALALAAAKKSEIRKESKRPRAFKEIERMCAGIHAAGQFHTVQSSRIGHVQMFWFSKLGIVDFTEQSITLQNGVTVVL